MRPVLAVVGAAFLVLSTPLLAAEAASTSAVDPARLAAARQTVDYVFPNGTYARMMGEALDKMMDSILDSTMRLPLKDLVGMSGVATDEIGEGSLAEIMEIYDPAYKERASLLNRTVMAEIGTLMTRFEPDIRSGLASAYAKRFDAAQLGELNRFFATPTGRAYAADSYLIAMSPEVMEKIQTFLPEMMQAMPAIMEKAKGATEHLPKLRTYADLSEPERAKLAKIIGISPKDLDEREATKAGVSGAEGQL